MKEKPAILDLLKARKAIDEDNIRWKDLAKECEISRPYLSQMIHGDVALRPDVLEILLEKLNLKDTAKRLGLMPE